MAVVSVLLNWVETSAWPLGSYKCWILTLGWLPAQALPKGPSGPGWMRAGSWNVALAGLLSAWEHLSLFWEACGVQREVSVRWHLRKGPGPSHGTWQLCTISCPQIPSLSLEWSSEKDLNPEQRHLYVIWEEKIPAHEIFQYEVNHSGLFLKRTFKRFLIILKVGFLWSICLLVLRLKPIAKGILQLSLIIS